HGFRPARFAAEHARHGHLVLRCLCLLAEGRSRKRQWPLAALATASHRHRSPVRCGNPGHRHNRQSNAEKMSRLQDAISGDPQSLSMTLKSASLEPVALRPRIDVIIGTSAIWSGNAKDILGKLSKREITKPGRTKHIKISQLSREKLATALREVEKTIPLKSGLKYIEKNLRPNLPKHLPTGYRL